MSIGREFHKGFTIIISFSFNSIYRKEDPQYKTDKSGLGKPKTDRICGRLIYGSHCYMYMYKKFLTYNS